jgi:hypothetical protein
MLRRSKLSPVAVPRFAIWKHFAISTFDLSMTFGPNGSSLADLSHMKQHILPCFDKLSAKENYD